jgi:hypothetical protein
MHGPGVKAHRRELGEVCDLCKRETLVLVIPKSKRRENDWALGVFDLNRISSSAGPGHVRLNQLRCISATSLHRCDNDCFAAASAKLAVTGWSQRPYELLTARPCSVAMLCKNPQ